jgi:hypothetical protein
MLFPRMGGLLGTRCTGGRGARWAAGIVGVGGAPVTVGLDADFVQPEPLGVGVAPGGRHEHLRRYV